MKKKIEARPRGRPATGKGEQVVVRIQPDLMSALDKHQSTTDAESRAAAIRQVLTDFFKKKRLL